MHDGILGALLSALARWLQGDVHPVSRWQMRGGPWKEMFSTADPKLETPRERLGWLTEGRASPCQTD